MNFDGIAITDYPLFPEEYGKRIPFRVVKIISWDNDKYVKISFNNKIYEVKAGYLYQPVDTNQIPIVK